MREEGLGLKGQGLGFNVCVAPHDVHDEIDGTQHVCRRVQGMNLLFNYLTSQGASRR